MQSFDQFNQTQYDPQSKPQVCVWYNVYCSCFLALYSLTTILGISIAVLAQELANDSSNPNKDAERVENVIVGVGLTTISSLLCIVFIVGLLIPRKKWGWIYGFFPIAVGLTSICCMPASIPLLVFWLKQNNRRWFNVN